MKEFVEDAEDNKILNEKRILIGVTGCIGAYKICSLINLLKKKKASVKVVMTESATKFVHPISFQTLTNSPVYISTFETHDKTGVEHIDLADWCDIFLIAPATANTISKIACGIADNLLSLVVCALPKKTPVLIAPAMNVHMWENYIIQQNVEKLKSIIIDGHEKYHFVGPGYGKLACGYEGEGVIIDNNAMVSAIEKLLS